jgi:hypothetical protein
MINHTSLAEVNHIHMEYLPSWLLWTSLEKTDVLAGVEDGAANLFAAEGEVDNRQGDEALREWCLQIPHGTVGKYDRPGEELVVIAR